METTTLALLLREEGIMLLPCGIALTVLPSWIVPGEDRLSYTTLIRLIECCREHHWLEDIQTAFAGVKLDSICKSFTLICHKPINVGARLRLIYEIDEVRTRSYSLKFTVRDENASIVYSEAKTVSVFFDPITSKSLEPPLDVTEKLRARHAQRNVQAPA